MGIKVARSVKGLSLSQNTLLIFGKNWYIRSKPIDTLMDPNIHFDQNLIEPFAHPEKYRRLIVIGKLIYSIVIRPYITFVVSVLSRYMQSLYQLHWTATCGILKRLQIKDYIIALHLIWILSDTLMLIELMILLIIILLLVITLLLEVIW